MNEKEYILTHILDCPRSDLYIRGQKPRPLRARMENGRSVFRSTKPRASARGASYLNDWQLNAAAQARLEKILTLRRRNIPLQYILGSVEFMDLQFKVDSRALIPRPETEILVEEALEEIRKSCLAGRRAKIENGRLLDLGTGSGNICVALAKHLPDCHILATDVSVAAVELAQENSRLNGAEGQVDFLVSDLFSATSRAESFDAIISNPPYISRQEMAGLAPEVRLEPQLALDGGLDGLAFYRRIIKESPDYLKKNGLLIMEMGYNQSNDIQEILRQSGRFEVERIVKDYRGIERVIIAHG